MILYSETAEWKESFLVETESSVVTFMKALLLWACGLWWSCGLAGSESVTHACLFSISFFDKGRGHTLNN